MDETTATSLEETVGIVDRAKVLLLGTFHSEEKLYEYARKRLGPKGADMSEEQLYFSLFEDVRTGFERLYRHDERHMLDHTLREHLLYLNSPENIRIDHGIYLAWVDGEPGDLHPPGLGHRVVVQP